MLRSVSILFRNFLRDHESLGSRVFLAKPGPTNQKTFSMESSDFSP